MRPDGTRVKDLPPLVAAIPYIMPKRYDAWNTITENIDEEVIKAFIRDQRRAGVRLNHMSVIIAAYYKATLENPKLNYFVMNRKIYKRNHFCVSFVIMKRLPDGSPSETTLKIYLEPEDTVFTVNEKIKSAIEANRDTAQSNSTDRFARFMFSVPGLPGFVVGLAYFLDKHGLLPRKIIDLSPFHTSLFITNLASIKTSYIHHHCYEDDAPGYRHGRAYLYRLRIRRLLPRFSPHPPGARGADPALQHPAGGEINAKTTVPRDGGQPVKKLPNRPYFCYNSGNRGVFMEDWRKDAWLGKN